MGVLGIAGFFPFAVGMFTACLDTSLTRVTGYFVTGVGLLITLGADLILFMRMRGFNFGFIRMAAAGRCIAAARVFGGAEVKIADFSLTDCNAVTV